MQVYVSTCMYIKLLVLPEKKYFSYHAIHAGVIFFYAHCFLSPPVYLWSVNLPGQESPIIMVWTVFDVDIRYQYAFLWFDATGNILIFFVTDKYFKSLSCLNFIGRSTIVYRQTSIAFWWLDNNNLTYIIITNVRQPW